ncbi:MAG TPA: MarR family transcriptional regulator [Candidatus Ornithomonoglobus intestinigallinarum]|uniref:MarR family transcriptional regulator n=1 Tax=Candidatus Ornithomonoglobus intestinigallinarum TaxID=2840894 RepID=A0A9D1KPZ9_9FIRM|nr:MarR family transcriptional regulator [Candidatus Ornithomonoglobus intestinigallinarum]
MKPEEGIGFYIKRINDYILADTNERLKKLDLTFSQMHILIYILMHGGRDVRQRDILHYFNIAHPTVVGLLRRMEKKGLVCVESDPDDRRGNCVTALPKANAILEQLKEGQLHIEALLTKELTPEQQAELKKILKIIYGGMYGNGEEKQP